MSPVCSETTHKWCHANYGLCWQKINCEMLRNCSGRQQLTAGLPVGANHQKKRKRGASAVRLPLSRAKQQDIQQVRTLVKQNTNFVVNGSFPDNFEDASFSVVDLLFPLVLLSVSTAAAQCASADACRFDGLGEGSRSSSGNSNCHQHRHQQWSLLLLSISNISSSSNSVS